MTIIQILLMISPIRLDRRNINETLILQRKQIDEAFASFEEADRNKEEANCRMLAAIDVHHDAQRQMRAMAQDCIKKIQSGEHRAIGEGVAHG